MANPVIALALGEGGSLLVLPVSSNTELGNFMHLRCADLDFDPAGLGSDKRRMQGLVAVGFRGRDIIVELSGNHPVMCMDHTECSVTILHRRHDNAKGVDIGQLLKIDFFAVHLSPDRHRAFCAAGNPGLDIHFDERAVNLVDNAGDDVVPLLLQERKSTGNRLGRIRVKFAEGHILELFLDLLDTDAFCKRNVNFHRLARYPGAFFRIFYVVQCPHVMEAVRELDEQNPDIFGDRQKQFTEILGMATIGRLKLKPRQLRDAVHQPRNLVAEESLDLIYRGDRVFDRIVQEPRHDRCGIQPILGKNSGNFDRM